MTDPTPAAALARLLALAPRVFPAVTVEDDWRAAVAQARATLERAAG